MKTLHAAIWGAGVIARTHAEILRELGIQLDVVVDKNLQRAKELAAEFEIERFSDKAEEILNSKVDCVHVCTPPNLHYEMICALFERGYHVFCEKPLCFEDAQASELCAMARNKGLVHGMDFNVRFHKGIEQAYRLVRAGELGAVRLVHGTYLQEFNAFPALLDWRYEPSLAGKMRAVTEIGSHWTDLIQFITGQRICSVSATFSNFCPDRRLKDGIFYSPETAVGEPYHVNSEDAALVQFRLESGAIGSVVLCEASPGRINHLTVEITGEKKNLWWDSEKNNELHVGVKNQGSTTWVYPFSGGFRDTQRELFRLFYKDVMRGNACDKTLYPTLQDGARNVFICNAIYESAFADGRWVEVKEEKNHEC